jgi:uncharacterized metal-binding protein YceD (DUF177 family)
VKDLRKYVIPFTGLKEGRHEFGFDVDDSFFEHFESSEITEGTLYVNVILVKKQQVLELDFDINGQVKTVCDRCLDEFYFPLAYQGKLFFKFGEESYELTDEIIILAASEHEINISQFIYEFIHLALPYRRIHPDINGVSGCNSEMIQKLYELRTDDKRNAGQSVTWDKLKEITDKN